MFISCIVISVLFTCIYLAELQVPRKVSNLHFFPESRSGTNAAIASSGNPTESENISNTPEIPTAVPEVGSVGSSEQIAVATGSRGALCGSPVPETKNSGTPPQDSTDVTAPEKLPVSVPEAGSVGSSEQIAVATGSCVALSSPVLETKNSGSPPCKLSRC